MRATTIGPVPARRAPRLRDTGFAHRSVNRAARRPRAAHSGGMTWQTPIIVHPPAPDGGRRVTVRGQAVGVARDDRDLVEFLRRAESK